MSTESTVAKKVCTLTIVEPGMPDRVIKIHPAAHETEKIWLDNRPGIERWAAVQQLLRQFCPRGRYVPDPAYWHQPGARPEDINTSTLKVEDIPVAMLEGAIFEPLAPKEHVSMPRSADLVKTAQENKDRMERLENRVDRLTSSIETLASVMRGGGGAGPQSPGPRR